MTDKYILDGHKAVPEPALMIWAQWMEKADRHVAKTVIGDVEISTVFLGQDHSFGDDGPLLFETMAFGGEHDQEEERYATWEQAEKGHKRWVEMINSELIKVQEKENEQ